MSVFFNSIDCVPVEILQQGIFPNCNAQDLAQCSRVSKKWEKLASADNLWIQAVPGISDLVTQGIKNYVCSLAVGSENKLLERFEEFTAKTLLNQKNRFACFFPYSPDSRFVVDIGFGDIDLSNNVRPDESQLCIFMNPCSLRKPNYFIKDAYQYRIKYRMPLDYIQGKTHAISILAVNSSFACDQLHNKVIEVANNRILELMYQHQILNTVIWTIPIVTVVVSFCKYLYPEVFCWT